MAVRGATAATISNGFAPIARLVAAGVNLAGVTMVLDLEAAHARLQADLDDRAAPDRGK